MKMSRLVLALTAALALSARWISPAWAQGESAPVADNTPSDNTTEELADNGEDITNPLNRFDLRLQVKTLPDATASSGQILDDRHAETLTLRSDLLLFPKPNQLALRFDLPLIWSNKSGSDNPNGLTKFGLGDFLAQAIYVRTLDPRWAGAIGMRTVVPTATSDAFGSDKLQLVPTVAVRAQLPEISSGSNVGVIARQFVSVAGDSSRSNINKFGLEPFLNIGLPEQWFVNSSPKMTYNLYTDKWFVPLDLMVGRKFGTRWVASLEYQYGLVGSSDNYKQWLELRVGHFF
ncbi:MAG: hypothetical protein WCE61_19885 [Candidatus Acidiferrum sp.]